MVAQYRIFRGTMTTWNTLFTDAAKFATSVGPERVISVAHSETRATGS